MAFLWLGESGAHDREVVGGKVAGLSALAASHRVPPGFCLVVEDGASEEEALDGLAEATPSSPSAPAARIRRSPSARRPSTRTASATSFAGQHESYLNVAGVDAVRDAVRRCWASGHAPRVLAYRESQGLAPPAAHLPVLVQQLVVADTSAVVFTVDPVTGNADEIVVNVSWGLGESIVGGSVTPDCFRVARDDLDPSAREIADKRKMTVAVREGTGEVSVPQALRRIPCVDDDQLRSMARLGLEVEERMGRAADIECCWSGTDLFLLQARAVTALPTIKEI